MNEEKKSIHKTLDQVRAKAAWSVVFEAKQHLKKDDFDKYKSLVKGFPADIINNGLGQAVAFLFSKKKSSPEGHLLFHLTRWLTSSDLNSGADISCYTPAYKEQFIENDPKLLIKCIWAKDTEGSRTYMRATSEALAFLDYLRKFAAGLSENGGSSEGEKA